jgi:hypothetical protein
MLGQEPLLLTPMRHFHIFRVDRLMLDHRLIFLFMGNSLSINAFIIIGNSHEIPVQTARP